ncbi:MAG: N-6 DNA methylase [Acidobacteria bacterium]|nr:N-6 DNA methylase [Acidobacteriota bacterium]
MGTRVSPLRRRDAIKKGLCRETADGNLQLTLEHKRDILLNNIYGVDLDAQAVEVAQLSLYLKLLEEETAATVQPKLAGLREQLLPNLNKNIVHGNSLIDYDIMDGQLFEDRELRKLNPMNFASTFPQVFANGGFDAIVGNPPYVRIQGFPQEQIRYFSTKYQASTGNFDIYVNFIERGLSLITPDGKVGQIVPNKFFKTDYGEGLRHHLTTQKAIEEIVDFGAEQVFNATIYTCLLFLSHDSNQEFLFATSLADQESLIDLRFETYSSNRFNGSAWLLVNDAKRNVLEKINQGSSRLLDLPADMSRGSSSGRDDVFMLDTDSTVVENEITRVPIFATDFNRYTFSPKGQWKIIFPYEINGNSFKCLDENDLRKRFPNAYSYLVANKAELLKRKQFNEWFAYSAPRNLNLHERASIFVPLLANRGLFSLVPTEYQGKLCPMASGGFTIALGESSDLLPQYVLGLLNSTLLFWMLENMSNVFRGGWITCTKQYFGELPIRTIDFTNPTEKAMHDKMVELVEKMIDGKKKLSAARTDADRALYERFCENLDRQIDDLVYQLYDITPEERKIIEGN